ncbi:MAG: hypothetical protein E7368_05180 [Clostridiales bacterium]|nr:hypothetical protein [Clostridiales bacterium]
MKNTMRKIVLVCLLLCTLLLSACGTYTPAGNGGNGGSGGTSGGGNGGGTIIVDPDDEDLFTVHLVYDGKKYVPTIAMEAFWTDGFSYHRAPFEKDGVARVDGLDGDYRVTLSNVPEGFAYDPSAYVATNDGRHITIELYKIQKTVGKGTELYKCIALNIAGVYQAEITSAEHIVYYEFEPRKSGVYTVESWVDSTENMVNPKLDIYTGTFAAKYYSYTMDDGGVESTFTKNCKYEVKIDEKEVGNCFTFGLKADAKNGYPQKIWFAVKRDGGFEKNWATSTFVLPTEDFSGKRALYGYHEYDSSYELRTPEVKRNGEWQYDGSLFGLNETDGWYHLYNESTGKYDGPILYAHISTPCQFYGTALTGIEYAGNKNLTLLGKGETRDNFKLFIEGFGAEKKGSFCVNFPQNNAYCPCHAPYQGGFCADGCATCDVQCTTVPQAFIDGDGGYADWCNSDGLYPVTEELKDFLYRFSTSQLLFMDGGGYCEGEDNLSGKEIDSKEEDQWLFACAYYVKK